MAEAQQPAQAPAKDSRAQLKAEIEAAGVRLADDLAELIGQVHPRAVLSNTVSEARQYAATSFEQAKAEFVDAGTGRPRVGRIGLLAAAVGGAVAFVLIARSVIRDS